LDRVVFPWTTSCNTLTLWVVMGLCSFFCLTRQFPGI
jgi:hypothetical protein